MLNQLVNRITSALDPSGTALGSTAVATLDIERVTTVLLVEIARADHDIGAEERRAIIDALGRSSTMSSAELNELVTDALNDADNAISLHEHVRMINEHFTKQHKIALVQQMWRVAIADGNVDSYEEYTIRKLCDLLHIKHRDYMQAKLHVMEET